MSDAPQTREVLIEALADIEHQRWSDWQRYQHDECCVRQVSIISGEPTGALVIPSKKVEHWERLIATPYADLPEHSKQADREQVVRYFPLIVEFVAQWIEKNCRDFYEGSDVFVSDWRDEMTQP